MSLRVYWISTSRRSTESRSCSSPDPQPQHPVDVLLRRAEAVDAGDRRHHDHVAPGQQGVGRGVAQPLDLLVDRGVLLDVGVGLGDVGLGLVVVVVGDEVLDRVVGEQLAQLVGELGGQRLVGLHHQQRSLHLLGHPRHGRGLAGAGGAEQHDVLHAALDPLGDLRDRRRLVAGRLVVGDHREGRHPALEIGHWPHGHEPTCGHRQRAFLRRVLGTTTLPFSYAAVSRASAPPFRADCSDPPSRRPRHHDRDAGVPRRAAPIARPTCPSGPSCARSRWCWPFRCCSLPCSVGSACSPLSPRRPRRPPRARSPCCGPAVAYLSAAEDAAMVFRGTEDEAQREAALKEVNEAATRAGVRLGRRPTSPTPSAQQVRALLDEHPGAARRLGVRPRLHRGRPADAARGRGDARHRRHDRRRHARPSR